MLDRFDLCCITPIRSEGRVCKPAGQGLQNGGQDDAVQAGGLGGWRSRKDSPDDTGEPQPRHSPTRSLMPDSYVSTISWKHTTLPSRTRIASKSS